MGLFLYISYSSGLSKEEKLIVDQSVLENRKKFCIFVKNINFTINSKLKKGIIVVSLVTLVNFSGLGGLDKAYCIGLPTPPPAIMRVQPHFRDLSENSKITHIFTLKLDHMSYNSFFKSKLLLYIYAIDPALSANPQISKLMKELRGGSWIGNAVFLAGLYLVYLWVTSEGFVIPYYQNQPQFQQAPGSWGPGNPPFHQRIIHPRGTSWADQPNRSPIMRMSQKSPDGNMTQVSNNVVPVRTQMSDFLDANNDVILEKCLNELNRRAKEIGCEFECSIERFRALATENGMLRSQGAREAISVLQGEMEGLYKNARREPYGPGINGPDFVVEGIGEFSNITHVEVKNPVGSSILKNNNLLPSISQQGKGIGKKFLYQQKFWSDPESRGVLPNVNSTAFFPASPANVLATIDNLDVPIYEKSAMEANILKGSQNNPNIVFLMNTNYNRNQNN